MLVLDDARRRASLVAAAALAASLLASSAEAQWFAEPVYAPMPPRAVAGMLYAQGFREVGRPRWTGDRYVVDGVDWRGVPVRLAVDPYGDVLSRRPLAAWRPVPPRNVGPGRIPVGPIDIGPIDVRRLNPFRDDARVATLPAAPGREVERRRERAPRQAALPTAKPPVARGKPSSPVEARAPEPSAAKPAVVPPAEPAPSAPPASPPAPAPAVEAPRPEAPREPAVAAAPNVRVIEGVTPVLPQKPEAAAEGEPPATADRREGDTSF